VTRLEHLDAEIEDALESLGAHSRLEAVFLARSSEQLVVA
jgi:hypothetical protein